MTVEITTFADTYTGDGSTTELAVSFPFVSTADLVVQLRDSTTHVVSSTLVLDTDYTATTNYPTSGGTVTLVSAPSSSYETYITREVALTQPLDILNQGGFYPDSIEAQLDRIVMMIQQVQAQI